MNAYRGETPAERQATARLLHAAETGTPCAPIRDLIGPANVERAYAIQQQLTRARVARGAKIIGRKTGLTSVAVQRQLNVDQPDFGVLFDDMRYEDGATVQMARLIQPKAEGELAFVLARDLDEPLITPDTVRSATAYVAPAIEIVDSRILDWDISFADTVADNASSGVFVIGPGAATLDELEPVSVSMSMSVNGVERSTGSGRACLGDPLNAVAWLAGVCVARGEPLHAGELILSGALGPMVDVTEGDKVHMSISGLGTTEVSFSKAKTS